MLPFGRSWDGYKDKYETPAWTAQQYAETGKANLKQVASFSSIFSLLIR